MCDDLEGVKGVKGETRGGGRVQTEPKGVDRRWGSVVVFAVHRLKEQGVGGIVKHR